MEQLKDKIEAVLKKYDSYEKDVFPRIVDDLLVCALSEKEWIKCSERMPGKEKAIAFVVSEGYGVTEAEWTGFTWVVLSKDYPGIKELNENAVTHWMPLPEPPKE